MTRIVELEQLICNAGVIDITGPRKRRVRFVTIDPNTASIDSLYLALPHPRRIAAGVTTMRDISCARKAGTQMFVGEAQRPADLEVDATWIRVVSIARAVEHVYAGWCSSPSHSLKVFALTGTKGKTTTTLLLHRILSGHGQQVGLINSVEWSFGSVHRKLKSAALPPGQLSLMLAEMREAGCTSTVVEVVSAALATDRLSATQVQVAGFTNLSRDHLDIHSSMEQYAAAKARLFSEHATAACFNVGDVTGQRFAQSFRGHRLTVSAGSVPAELTARTLESNLTHTVALLEGFGQRWTLHLPLPGTYNLENALVAIGMAALDGVPVSDALNYLLHVEAPPGRLQRIQGPRHVYVDYAHTPDSLSKVLSLLRPYCQGRLICVFGAGGDRDRGKRPEMGAAASANADLLILTSDNSRSESTEKIVAEIMMGVPETTSTIIEMDRRSAIFKAVHTCRAEDIVIVAGRGSEEFQEIGNEQIPLRDELVVKEAFVSMAKSGVC